MTTLERQGGAKRTFYPCWVFDEQPNATDQLKVCRLNSNNNQNSMETYLIGGWALVPDHARPIHWIKKTRITMRSHPILVSNFIFVGPYYQHYCKSLHCLLFRFCWCLEDPLCSASLKELVPKYSIMSYTVLHMYHLETSTLPPLPPKKPLQI